MPPGRLASQTAGSSGSRSVADAPGFPRCVAGRCVANADHNVWPPPRDHNGQPVPFLVGANVRRVRAPPGPSDPVALRPSDPARSAALTPAERGSRPFPARPRTARYAQAMTRSLRAWLVRASLRHPPAPDPCGVSRRRRRPRRLRGGRDPRRVLRSRLGVHDRRPPARRLPGSRGAAAHQLPGQGARQRGLGPELHDGRARRARRRGHRRRPLRRGDLGARGLVRAHGGRVRGGGPRPDEDAQVLQAERDRRQPHREAVDGRRDRGREGWPAARRAGQQRRRAHDRDLARGPGRTRCSCCSRPTSATPP